MLRPLSALALLGLLVGFSAPILLLPSVAHAQDDTRVLRARRMAQPDVSAEMRAQARVKRAEAIAFLKDLLATSNPEGDRKAEMMLRLASLYFDDGRDVYYGEMERHDAEYERCFNTEGCDTTRLRPDNSASIAIQNKAIKLYEAILANYQRYARADEATYYLGSALTDVGRPDDGVEYFVQLVKMYPESAFVPDAYVQIGEYYFEQENAYKALLAYKKATAYPEHEMYGFAMYKLAWCYYNVGEYGKAIDTMKTVVDYSQGVEQAGAQGSRLALSEEALKDLVRFFADAGQLEEAYEYFGKLGKRDLIHAMLKRLASTYMEQGKWEEAVQTYRRLIAEDPQSPKNPDYQHEIVTAYTKMGNSEATFTEVDRMLKTYGTGTAWARANASDQDVIRGAQARIEKDILTVATYHHDRGRKLAGAAQAADFDLASRAYAVYLDEYPSGSQSYDVHYQYAELLYKTKRYEAAYAHYVAVVDADPNGKHSRFCAESAIFAAEEMIKQEQAASPAPSATSTDPIPLTPWEQKLVDSCDRYVRLYPDDGKVRNILYKSAYVLYHKHQLELAAERFRKVIALDPASREAEQAAHLILDSFVLKEDWGNLATNAKFFHEQQGLGSKTFKKEVYEIYQNASLKLVEVGFERDRDYGKAADAYMRFYEAFPESADLARVLNNAALYYREAGRVGDSMKVRRILVEDPRFGDKTKYYYTQIGALGFDHETVADFDQAAFYYEKLFGLYPKEREKARKAGGTPEDLTRMDQSASDAIYSAAVFRRALGQDAIPDYKAFVATFPTDARADAAQLLIGTIYAEKNDHVQAGTVFYNYYTRATPTTPADLVYYARLHYAKALEAQAQGAKAKKVYEETIAAYKKEIAAGGKPGPHTDYVAEMMYILAAPIYTAYDAKKVTGCGCRSQSREDAALGDTLKAKFKGLAEVESAYAEIIRTGSGEWGLAALVQLGRSYDGMATTLRESDIPYYLTEDQREIYLMRLEDKIYPQTQKAIEAYKAAMEKSWDLTLYNDATSYATRRLGELAPDDYPGLREDVPLPKLPASAEDKTFSFETSL